MSAADSASSPGAGLAAVEQPQAIPERPWLGLAYFTEADHDYFYGRDPEVRELSDRVRRAPLTVLYGVSGYGKSSIIGAGVIPMLRAAGHPIVLLRRCYDDLASRPLHGDVIAACASEIPGCLRPEAPEALTLWQFFHDRSQPWFQRAPAEEDADSGDVAGSVAPPVLILDQFEEIFVKGEDRASSNTKVDTLARESARTFLMQLADLVENRPPTALRERLQSGPPDERRAVMRRFDFQARPVRVAVVVRDDFLARLERWRRAMPSLMEHRVELRLLSGPQAYKAAYEPGAKRLGGQPPILPADVATRIVRAAAGAAQDVPIEEIDAVPPILSLICERLNDQRLAASPPPASIAAADFSPGEAERILGRFYDDKLRPHPNALRFYLEDKLVSDSGFRENVTLVSALASLRGSVPDAGERLRQLVDDRVLVIEDRGGVPRVEFTHDTLAKLALDRRVERQARARRRKAIAWTGTSLVVAGISIGLTIWALAANARAQAATFVAKDRAEEAEREKARAQAATARAEKQTALAEQEKARTLDLIRFMDVKIGEAFIDVPVQLRERVSDRLDAFYRSQGEPATFEGRHRRMGHHMRKAMVHLAVGARYLEENFSEVAKNFDIESARRSAMSELQEALRLGDILAKEAPGNRRVTRDRILTRFHMATVLTQLGDSDAAARYLNDARTMLDELVKAGPFSLVPCVDWMGLPNPDAAMGDWAWDAGDASASHAWYEKALQLQNALVARRPNDPERAAELKRIKERLEESAPKE